MTFVPKGFVNKVDFPTAREGERIRVTALNRQTTFLPDDHPSRVKKGEIIPLAKPNISLKPGEFMEIMADHRDILLNKKFKLFIKRFSRRLKSSYHKHFDPSVEKISLVPK